VEFSQLGYGGEEAAVNSNSGSWRKGPDQFIFLCSMISKAGAFQDVSNSELGNVNLDFSWLYRLGPGPGIVSKNHPSPGQEGLSYFFLFLIITTMRTAAIAKAAMVISSHGPYGPSGLRGLVSTLNLMV
jgi:hypothetical protein